MRIVLHPWINDGWVKENNIGIFFTTGEVIGNIFLNDKQRIAHIRKAFPGVIEKAEAKFKTVKKLLGNK